MSEYNSATLLVSLVGMWLGRHPPFITQNVKVLLYIYRKNQEQCYLTAGALHGNFLKSPIPVIRTLPFWI